MIKFYFLNLVCLLFFNLYGLTVEFSFFKSHTVSIVKYKYLQILYFYDIQLVFIDTYFLNHL